MRLLRFLSSMAMAMLITAWAWGAPPTLMQVQGILTDANGVPLINTSRDVDFTIYDGPGGPAAIVWGPENHPGVATDNAGRFSHILGNHGSPITDAVFSGAERWLGIKVGADAELTPRTRILTSGYAFRVATVDHSAVNAKIAGTSYISDAGLVLDSTLVGLQATGGTYGVYAVSPDAYGAYGAGEDIGLYGAAYPTVGEGRGVYGFVSSGLSTQDKGVYGNSDDWGVYGVGGTYSIYGNGGSRAVYGTTTDASSYGGYFSGELDGVLGYSTVVAGVGGWGVYGDATNASFAGDRGVYGNSDEIGVYGNTTDASGDWGLYTPDDIFVGGACTGCLSSFAARNGGSEPLEIGQSVAAIGVEPPLQKGGPPVMVVRRAASGDAVIGVVRRAAQLTEVPVQPLPDKSPTVSAPIKPPTLPPTLAELTNDPSKFQETTVEQSAGIPERPVVDESRFSKELTLRYKDGAATAGELLVIVTHGPTYAQVSGSAQVGDLLIASSMSGKAQVAELPTISGVTVQPAGVFARVLGPADSKSGLVPVLVTLR